MKPEDAPRLLAMAAARDNRKRNDAMALAWYQDLGDLDFDLAVEAMNRHYRTSTEYLMPVHIRQLADEIDRDRRRAAREAREAAEKEAERLALEAAPRTDRSRELAEGIRAIVAARATPDAAHERALLVARQMKGRPAVAPKVKSHDKPKRIEHGPPKDSATAALARQYLADGYSPDDLADRLWISKKWLRKAAADRASLPKPTPVPHVTRSPKEPA